MIIFFPFNLVLFCFLFVVGVVVVVVVVFFFGNTIVQINTSASFLLVKL